MSHVATAASATYLRASMKISQRLILSSFRIPRSNQGSFFRFSRTSFSSSALTMRRAPRGSPLSSTKGPPIKMKPWSTRSSMKAACSSQKGCSRVPFDGSRLGPAEEITVNVFFISGYDWIYCPQLLSQLVFSFTPYECHSEQSEESQVILFRSPKPRSEMFRFAQHDK